jgi:predicted nucleic acid-binding Zn ribbon protein
MTRPGTPADARGTDDSGGEDSGVGDSGDLPVAAEAQGSADAAAQALARARTAAAAKGLRPGMKPRSRRASGAIPDDRDGRDPQLLGDALDGLVAARGWELDIEVGAVMGRWDQIVGAEIAAHCVPVTFADGVLVVSAESTSWATQLSLLKSHLVARIAAETGPDTVTDVRIVGPSAPSWKHGRRSVTGGRGPRDTYG